MRQILLILIGLSIAVQAGDPRFVRDATTQIVTDTQTNLQWQDDNATKTTSLVWQSAIGYCEALDTTAVGGYDDWRLPNFNELYYIADRSIYSPALSSVFVNVISSGYWTATTDASDTSNAWIVDFNAGYDYGGDKGASSYVRCVRAGQ